MKNKTTQVTIDPAVEFPKVEKMLYALAWKFADKYPYPNREEMFDACKSEAYWAFMRACKRYSSKPISSKFSTVVYFMTSMRLRTLTAARSTDPLIFVEIDDDLCGEAAPMHNETKERIEDLIQDLSSDAKEIVLLLVEMPSDLLVGLPRTTEQLMKRVRNYMVSKRGRSREAVEAAHEELRGRFSQAWAN